MTTPQAETLPQSDSQSEPQHESFTALQAPYIPDEVEARMVPPPPPVPMEIIKVKIVMTFMDGTEANHTTEIQGPKDTTASEAGSYVIRQIQEHHGLLVPSKNAVEFYPYDIKTVKKIRAEKLGVSGHTLA